MNPILRNILAFIAAFFAGNILNGGLIFLGMAIIPPPEGVNVMDPESIKAGMHLFETKHFIFPFLAHAIGTLVAAFLVARLAANNKRTFAWLVGGLFLLAGIYNVSVLPAPMWFNVLDLVGAYLPMAWLGGNLGIGKAERY